MDEKSSAIILISGFLSLFGIVFFIIGMVMLKHQKKKESNCTAKTTGKVTDVVLHQNRDMNGEYSTLWHPTFEYSIGDQQFIQESHYGNSPPKFTVGQKVEIYYNPEDYTDYYVAEETSSKTLGTVFTLTGSLSLIGAIFLSIFLWYIL